MTNQPRLRVKTKHNTHTYMMTIKPEEFNHDYTLTVPSTPFRKDFVDNELWGQMRIYNDTYDTNISCTALCLDAEYNVLGEYLQNTEYDGVVPFECDLGNDKAFTLSDEGVTRIHFLSPSDVPVGNYIRAILLDGGDYPLTNQPIHYHITKTDGTKYIGDITTDNKGICFIPKLLDSGDYKVILTYGGGDIEDVHYNTCSNTKWIQMDGLHDTSIQIFEDYYTTQDEFHMIKTEGSEGITYTKALDRRKVMYVLGSDLFVTLTDKEENSRISNETVNLQVEGRTYTSKTNEEGVATFRVYLDNGDYNMSLSYKGSNYYNSSQNTVRYTLCVHKNKSARIRCANADNNGYQLVTRTGNLRFKLEEKDDTPFTDDNFYEVFDETTGITYFYKDSACTQLWINGTNDSEFLETTLKTQKPKVHYTTISSASNHIRELTYAGSLTKEGEYIKEGTQKAKEYYGITIGIPQKPTQPTYWVKVTFKGDNYFSAIKDEKFHIYFKHMGGEENQKSATSIGMLYTKHIIDSKNLQFRVVSEYNEFLKGKSVSFTVQGKSYTAKIEDNGLVSFPVSLKSGLYSAVVKFAGNTFFKRCSKKITFRVLKEKSNSIIDEPIRYLANFNSHLVIPDDINSHTEYVQFVYTISVRGEASSDTPNIHIYFNNFMLNTGGYRINYIQAEEEQDVVNYKHSYYALLYRDYQSNNGIEVIRPSKSNFTTKRLYKNEHTIISPFHNPTIREDKPDNICKEYLNFHNQTINISQDNQ